MSDEKVGIDESNGISSSEPLLLSRRETDIRYNNRLIFGLDLEKYLEKFINDGAAADFATSKILIYDVAVCNS